MALTTLASHPAELTSFAGFWKLTQFYSRIITVDCAGCDGVLTLAMGTDTQMPETDVHAFVVMELLWRGWMVRGRCGYCPACRC